MWLGGQDLLCLCGEPLEGSITQPDILGVGGLQPWSELFVPLSLRQFVLTVFILFDGRGSHGHGVHDPCPPMNQHTIGTNVEE